MQAFRLPSIEDGISCPDDIDWLIHALAVLSLGPVSRLAESHDHVKDCYIGGFTGFAGSRSVMKVCWLQDSYVDVRKRPCPRIHMLTSWISYAELVPDTEHPLNRIRSSLCMAHQKCQASGLAVSEEKSLSSSISGELSETSHCFALISESLPLASNQLWESGSIRGASDGVRV